MNIFQIHFGTNRTKRCLYLLREIIWLSENVPSLVHCILKCFFLCINLRWIFMFVSLSLFICVSPYLSVYRFACPPTYIYLYIYKRLSLKAFITDTHAWTLFSMQSLNIYYSMVGDNWYSVPWFFAWLHPRGLQKSHEMCERCATFLCYILKIKV